MQLLRELASCNVEGGGPGEVLIDCPAPYRHKSVWINPIEIMERGIEVYVRFQENFIVHFTVSISIGWMNYVFSLVFFQWFVQHENQYVFTPPDFFHQGVNLGPNIHEAWSLTTPSLATINISQKNALARNHKFPKAFIYVHPAYLCIHVS